MSLPPSHFTLILLFFFAGLTRQEFFEEIDNLIPETLSHTNLLRSWNNLSCHRTWNANVSKTLHELKEAATNFTFLTRQESFQALISCRRAIPHWPFCVMDRSPYGLQWAFFSVLTCKNVTGGSTFRIIFDKTIFLSPTEYRYASTKFIKVWHPNLNNQVMNRAYHFKRRCDFHSQTEAFLIIAIIVGAIAEHLNTSVAVLDHRGSWKRLSKSEEQLLLQSPTIHPRSFGRTLTLLDQIAIIDSAMFTRIESVDFNFVYCDTPKLLRSEMYDMGVILQAFHPNVWFFLILILLLCSVIISKTFHPRDISSAMLSLFAGLLGGNFQFGPGNLKKSTLFILWLLTSIIINNFYTGSMTSVLITPLKEHVMRKVAELDEQNYSIIFPAGVTSVVQVVNATAFGHSSRWNHFGRHNDQTTPQL